MLRQYICNLRSGSDISEPDLWLLERFIDRVEIHSVSPTDVPNSWSSYFEDDLYSSFVVLANSQPKFALDSADLPIIGS